VIGDVTPIAVVPAPIVTAAAPVACDALETPLMITCATRKYLPSLQHWLTAIQTQAGAMKDLKVIVFLSSDVPEDTGAALKEKFAFSSFEKLPDSQPLPGAFPDFWDPQHFGWKLWILNEISGRSELSGKMIFYMDAGSFLCRWPQAWMRKAQATGLCFLEDPREENKRWCSPEFCAALSVTEAELGTQQIQAANILFRAGASNLFKEALELAKRKEVLVGPKWAGTLNGKPYGHRHDQSILSILSHRQRIAREPLDTVCCGTSLRKTFTTGRAIYAHRGNFQVHRDFSEAINEAYVINLDRRQDRLERLWQNCGELQGRVERWPAVDGRSLELTPAIQRLLKPNDFFWKKAISGCALSHLGLWWKLANDTPDIQNYLIMEDDVKFRPGWENVWKAAVGDIPEDYDIIYLGGVLPPNREMFDAKCKERVNDSFSRIKENSVWGQTTSTRYFHFCAYSYILTRAGAQKIINLIKAHDGIWTSADHVLCNPVNVLRSYILDPMVAGCYQDDDPKYANSQFNDFSRIDGFDSDLWNNDERFEVVAVAGDLDIGAALRDATAPIPKANASPVLVAPPATRKEVKNLPRRIVALAEQNLDILHLHEGQWLLDLFDRPTSFTIDKVTAEGPPPKDEPIVIVQRPYVEKITHMLEKWDSFGVKFSILHLSDEYCKDDVSFYDLSGCKKVVRFYKREGLSDKVTTIPLGFHWTLNEGSQNVLMKTPRLPFRMLTWSFFGTDWNDRRKVITPLFDVSGANKTQFFKDWKDPDALDEKAYISNLLDTVFVPCPDGMNPETFRFYEALECGCVPLLVRTDTNSLWVDWVTEHLQILALQSWEEAAKFIRDLMINKNMLESYRTKLLTSWMAWRTKLKEEVREFLQV
jgi:GR25 family glycosyltransferase involved in LPS biosynthesis